jgi:thiol-disulfide isomerase/thioredoxin
MDNNDSRWVDDHLAKLGPDDNWQPDVERGLARMRTPVKSRGQKWLWAGTAVLASGAGLMAFPSPRAIAHKCVSACEELFTNGTSVQPVQPVELTFAPDFALKDSSGALIRLSDYKDKVVLLNFWATWCLPCRTEMPWFAEFEEKYKDRGLAVLGVTMDCNWPQVSAVLAQLKVVRYPLVESTDDVAQMYGVKALPMTLLIDVDGRVKAIHSGIVDKGIYENEIVQLLDKTKGGSQ